VQCADCQSCTAAGKVMRADLEAFCAAVLGRYGVPPSEAALTARVLVAADVRGIASHGVARLGRYLKGLKDGYIRPGIEPEVLSKVCDPFFTTKPIGEGTGLGLAVTLGIARAHKGDLEIKSTVGQGTEVILWLPAHDRR